MQSSKEILIALSIKHQGDWSKIYQAIVEKEQISMDEVHQIVNGLKCNAITILDEEYPDNLKYIYQPPFVLFYYGDISLIKDYNNLIAVVGSREYSPYSKKACEDIIFNLKDKYAIVSGLAKGIDSIAHYAAINSNKKTIAVLGTGINTCYPKENIDLYNEIKDHHLLISEYYQNGDYQPSNFVSRNRIVTGLAKGLIVPEVKKKSGTMTSIVLAMKHNREIMIVPHPVNDDTENNRLIASGAYLVETAEDVENTLE